MKILQGGSTWTGFGTASGHRRTPETVHLADTLHKRVIGQDAAVKSVAKRWYVPGALRILTVQSVLYLWDLPV